MPDKLSGARVVGARQTIKAIETGRVKMVYIAMDADERLVDPVKSLCESSGTPYTEAQSMQELGRACGISVGAAVAAELK